MKEKILKYYKVIIFLLLSINLIGLFFIYTEQFKTISNDNVLDFIPSVSVAYNEYRTALAWVALVFMAIAWIMWEFAISKGGKKIYAFISMGLFFIQMLLILNLLSTLSILIALLLMGHYTWEKISWQNQLKNSEVILNSAEENKKNNSKFKNLFKRKSKN